MMGFMTLCQRAHSFCPLVEHSKQHMYDPTSFLECRPDSQQQDKRTFVTRARDTSWSDIMMHADGSVCCLKHFPPFSTGTLPFLPAGASTVAGNAVQYCFPEQMLYFSFLNSAHSLAIVHRPLTNTGPQLTNTDVSTWLQNVGIHVLIQGGSNPNQTFPGTWWG